jgi:hypothetical protein
MSTISYLIEADSTAGPITINLPNMSTYQVITVKDVGGVASANNITVVPWIGTIDGDVSSVLYVNYQSINFYFDGSNYYSV